ncbi:MAG: aminotransferase class I/II-fold pyridoxal phosphate-dependent enzyme [Calditrichaeota bacterium]|nr:aminotransferase class I/II-fold pyridoxal phosphate-dependent enzyme [Calditrichota bacterium]
MTKKDWHIDTISVHGADAVDKLTGAVAPPIYQTSTFEFDNADQGEAIFKGEQEGYIYTRVGNPTQAAFERHIAALECGEAGLAFASGLSAISGLVLTLCNSGDNIVSSNTLYGGTHYFFQDFLKRMNIDAREVPADNLSNLENAIDENTKLIFIETPANPNLDIIDIAGCVEIARRKGIPLAVDNTFATPILTRPLEFGADVVMHSATKYISGHGDAVAGALVGTKELMTRIRKETLMQVGLNISPFNAWLLLRGLKTLSVRMRKHCENAAYVARFLKTHPKVAVTHFPGLSTHPGHAIAREQMSGQYGGMVAFELKGTREDSKKLMDSIEMSVLAVSLGDCDTLICHPASTTHAKYTPEELAEAHIGESMIRLSVGIEDAQDICDDLEQALQKIG